MFVLEGTLPHEVMCCTDILEKITVEQSQSVPVLASYVETCEELSGDVKDRN